MGRRDHRADSGQADCLVQHVGIVKNAGVVTFHRLSATESKVMLQLEYEPETLGEKVGDFLGAVGRRVEGDLGRFKEFIEARDSETGAWRGEVKAK